VAAILKRRRDLAWVPTVVVLAVVLIAGSRLMYLSVQHHATAARTAASNILAGYVGRIEPELQKLATLASRQAAAANRALADTNTPTALESVPLPPNTFWMTPDDRVLSSRPTEVTSAGGIASEWESAESARHVTGSSVLGPMRLGSQWLLAARVPVTPVTAGAQSTPAGWAVSYGDLDELIAGGHLARLTDAGYDFQVSQVEPRSARTRIFLGSSSDPLADAVTATIHLPSGFVPAIQGSYLQIAIRPRAGWYPATELASDIGLLAFLAWLLAFGTHDLSHALQRSRAALTAARKRLRTINQQLATEMQQRLNLQETFDHARFHDAFTGLPNRRYFMDQLDRALRDVRTKRRQRITVILVDISRFKLINDMLGHTAGDELMVQAARRFEKSTSSYEGVLARWGADSRSHFDRSRAAGSRPAPGRPAHAF
jgi:Diguanylate cyclase, GGDEF domain